MGKGKKKDDLPEIKRRTSVFWYIFGFVVFIAACLHIAAMILYDWRVAKAMNYNYQYRGKSEHHNVFAVKYGLYKIWYDGGSKIVTWNKRVATSEFKGNGAILMGKSNSGTSAQWASMCPEQCQDAIATRITAYKRIQLISISLLAVMAVSGGLAMIGIAWLFLLGPNTFLLLGLWGIAGAATVGLGIYWFVETNEAFWLIVNSQQVPFPTVGYCWYLLIAGGGAYLLSGIAAIILDSLDKYFEDKEMENALRSQLIEGQQKELFMGMPIGMPPPMGGPPSPFGGPSSKASPYMCNFPPGTMGNTNSMQAHFPVKAGMPPPGFFPPPVTSYSAFAPRLGAPPSGLHPSAPSPGMPPPGMPPPGMPPPGMPPRGMLPSGMPPPGMPPPGFTPRSNSFGIWRTRR